MEKRKVIIIAEAGVNHNGNIDIARQLIDAAADAEADIVKFQTFKADKIASSKAKKADYQMANLNNGDDTQIAMLKKLELPDKLHIELKEYCKTKNIQFLSTPFDLDSIDFLKSISIRIGKIPSGEITNLPYLRKMAESFDELILSTGMSDLSEVSDAVQILERSGMDRNNLVIMHCNTEYPTPMTDVNLKAMLTLKEHFGTSVGYSDHTEGIEVAIAAVALGATMIEKHFTLDKNMEGPDHKASLEPDELKQMVKAIRNIEMAMGTGIKKPSKSESKNIVIVRKSIIALKNIKKGEMLDETNITVKRPGTGISPMNWEKIVGTNAIRDFNVEELIEI